MESEVGQQNRALMLLVSQQLSQVLRRHDEQEARLEQLHQKLDRAIALETQYQMVPAPEAAVQRGASAEPAEDDTAEWLTDLFHAWCCGCGCGYALV
jgi:hypothetical protein